MLDRVILWHRPEDGGLSIDRPVHRGRVAKLNIQQEMDGSIVYTTEIKEALGIIVLAGQAAPTEKVLSEIDYAKAIAAGAFESDQELIDRIISRLPEGATDVRATTEAAIPKGRTFRAAWRHAGDGAVRVDMPIARGIMLDRIRAARDTSLSALDILWSRAMARGDVAAAATIEVRRQVLRDLPSTIKLDQATPEALAAAWPAELPPPA